MHDQINSDLYDVLGVSHDATAKEISKAYKALAREFHPDVNQEAEAEERFKQITAAYDVLGDETKRAEYDQFTSMVGPGFGADSAHHARSGYGNPMSGISMEDLLGQMFAGNSGSPFGADFGPVSTTVTLDFEEAVRGTTVMLQTASGPFAVPTPAGVNDGAQMLVRTNEGDVLVAFSVRPHASFGREGDNLTLVHTVPFTTMCLGGRMTVQTLEGKSVTLRIPEGTPSGRTFRIPGRGVNADDRGAGDLLVRVAAEIPTELNDAQRDALAAFVAASADGGTTSDLDTADDSAESASN